MICPKTWGYTEIFRGIMYKTKVLFLIFKIIFDKDI